MTKKEYVSFELDPDYYGGRSSVLLNRNSIEAINVDARNKNNISVEGGSVWTVIDTFEQVMEKLNSKIPKQTRG